MSPSGGDAARAAILEHLLMRSVFEAARGLLGFRVRTEFDGRVTEVILTEVEAYAGAEDPASHAYRGRTPRNSAMFASAGTLYVYRSYGIHWCMNVVVGEPGLPHAVLLRGGEPTVGREVMEQRRSRIDHLTDGPGKLCAALGVTGDHDGTSVFDGPVKVFPGDRNGVIEQTPRVGLTVAKDMPWRYTLEEESRVENRRSPQPPRS